MLQRIDVRNERLPPSRRVLSKPMSEHKVTLTWQRGDKPFDYQKYSRDHTWKFPVGTRCKRQPRPSIWAIRTWSIRRTFVASLSSCHMLTFLAIACKKKFVLDEYVDDAVGHMEKMAEENSPLHASHFDSS